ncbi:MAG: GTPase HflX [Pirellulaceae bacterium]|nr:GTPase HflX [Pirellulaceae bacterium]
MPELERLPGVASESAVLVRVLLSDQSAEAEPLEELRGLAVTAGTQVVGGLIQRRDRPDAGTYLGKGKLEELKLLVEGESADVVIFDNDLSPGQTRNLEKELQVKVLDRTELILDIFASNARTYEARLAVELAQLEYSLPRLKRMWTHLSRLKLGVGMRGPGEKQLEVDRRLVEKRIHDLRHDLRAIEQRKERQVAARRDHMTVSLVGYTNAGKSTLMNALTQAGVLAADKLFATLDTRTRRWQLPNWGPVLLSDTVGFIRDLPHRLIASFKATLEEARQADLLLHVADAANPAVRQQISAVYEVLKEIGIEEKDTLLILNKTDQPTAQAQMEALRNRYPNAVPVSARAGTGLGQLAMSVSDALSRSFSDVDVETSVENGKLMAYLAAHGEVLSKRFHDHRVTLHCRLPQKYLGRIPAAEAIVSEHPSDTPAEYHPGGERSGIDATAQRAATPEDAPADSVEDVA